MNFAFIYIRVSDQQQVRGSSLSDQEQVCREFAARNGYEVAAVYRDDGRSAYKDDVKHRPQFAQMLSSVRTGRRCQAIIVYKLDRFARRARIFHTSRYELEQAGVQLLSATEPNEASAAGRLSAGMLAEFAEFYSAQLSERLKNAARSKAARGLWVGPAPYGYRLEQRQLVVAPEHEWVVHIFRAYDEGSSVVQISAALNTAGVASPSGKPWTKDAVLSILKNHAYIGKAGGRNLDIYQAQHQALITEELWERVQSVMGKRRRRPRGPQRKARAQPLSYRPRCALCNANMHRYQSANGKYLRCRGSTNKTCTAKGVSLDLVEHQVELLRKSGATIDVVYVKAPRGVETFEEKKG